MGWLNLPHSPSLPPPVTAKQRVVKLLEINLNEGEMATEGKTEEGGF